MTEKKIKPLSNSKKDNFGYLKKSVVCVNYDKNQCNRTLSVRWVFISALLLTIVSTIIWGIIYLTGGYEYNDTMYLVSGIFIIVTAISGIATLVFGVTLLFLIGKETTRIAIIIPSIIVGLVLIFILLLHSGIFA